MPKFQLLPLAAGVLCALSIYIWRRVRLQEERRRQEDLRKAVEEALLRSESMNRAILNAIPDLMFRMSRGGVYLDFKGARGIDLFMPASDFLNKNVNEVMPDKIAQQTVRCIEEAIRTDKVQSFEYLLTIQGTMRAYEARMTTCGDQEVLVMVRDITARKRVEEALRNAKDDLEMRVQERTASLTKANEQLTQEIAEHRRTEKALKEQEEQLRHAQKMEAIGRLAGGMAHDFNNQLAVIKGYVDLLLDPLPEGSTTRDDLLKIRKAVQRSAALTERLLVFSSKQQMELRPLDLNRQASEIQKMLARLLDENVVIALDLEEDLRTVNADPTNIDQIFANLAINARDAMREGGTLIFQTRNVVIDEASCERVPGARPGPFVRLSVSDTGTGMSEEVRSHLFEPFFTTKGPGKGTGLGLSIVYGIVQAHKGWITVETRLGQGSRFEIFLPVVEKGEEVVHREEEPASLARFRGSKERILLVEDDLMVRDMIEQALKQKGYNVRVCATVSEGMDIFQEATFDLVLSDVMLPDGRGTDLVFRLRRAQPSLAGLFITGHTDERADWEQIRRVGLSVLLKPFGVDSLLEQVDQALQKRGCNFQER
ncbi:MAG: response regulator [Candidatus Latescibacteria bacterium]|nr:response regulator [Candidatus Latescibacterota bacterium]